MGKEGGKAVFCVFVWVIVLGFLRSNAVLKVKGLFIEASGVVFARPG